MRVLFDENLPRQLMRDLTEYEVATVTEMGWSGVKNGRLLRLAASRFDVLLTADRNIRYQTDVRRAGLAVVMLAVPDTKLETIRALHTDLPAALTSGLQPGSIMIVGTWRVD